MTSKEPKIFPYRCKRLGKRVVITEVYRVYQTPSVKKEVLIRFDCDCRKECGVYNSSATNDKWSKCEHPDCPNNKI